MRYRPFGVVGKAVSAVSLLLRESGGMPNAAAWRSYIFAAMECGVNAFELVEGSDVLPGGMAGALEAVERRLLFLAWRPAADRGRMLDAHALSASVRTGLQCTGAGYFDLVMLDERALRALTPDGRQFLGDLRSAGLALQTGVCGDGADIDGYIAAADFDVLSTPFSITSDSVLRRRIKEASSANMAVVAHDPFPAALMKPGEAAARPGLLRRMGGAGGPAPAAPYAFLFETRGWAPDEICLAYTLTEPAFATVQLEPIRLDVLERLAAVTDKDLPTGIAAQIEMARFGAEGAQRRA